MPYSLTSQKVSFTYGRLVQTVSGSYYDGFGNLLNLSGSGTVLHTGSTYPITASWSETASYALNSKTASYALNAKTASYVINSKTSSYTLHAESASYSLNSTTSSYSLFSETSSHSLTAETASYALTAKTSSYSLLAKTSSYALNTISASYVETASYALDSDKLDGQHGSYYQKALVTGSTYPITASWAQHTLSSSYSNVASSSIYAQDIVVYVKNGSGATIPRGKVVRIIGADNSANTPTIGLADASNEGNSANTLGFLMQSLNQGSFGYVLTEGKFFTINTQAFLPGDLLYLSSSGSITNVPPVAPNHGVRLGEVIRSQLNNGSIYVRIDNGTELGELHNVVDTTTNTSYGDLLVRSGSVWHNSKNLTGSYSLEGTFVLTHVSQSLNFANDATAAAGGVPLGGLYRNGNVIQIRIV